MNSDPFSLLKEMMETSTFMNLSSSNYASAGTNDDPRFVGYQNFSSSIASKAIQGLKTGTGGADALSGIIKNKDLFLKA